MMVGLLGGLFVVSFLGGGGRFVMDSVGMNMNVKKGRMLDGDLGGGDCVVPYAEVSNVTIHEIRQSFQLYSLLTLLENREVGVNSKLDALGRNDFLMWESGLRGFRLTHGLLSDW
jgi:hypothetical protein